MLSFATRSNLRRLAIHRTTSWDRFLQERTRGRFLHYGLLLHFRSSGKVIDSINAASLGNVRRDRKPSQTSTYIRSRNRGRPARLSHITLTHPNLVHRHKALARRPQTRSCRNGAGEIREFLPGRLNKKIATLAQFHSNMHGIFLLDFQGPETALRILVRHNTESPALQSPVPHQSGLSWLPRPLHQHGTQKKKARVKRRNLKLRTYQGQRLLRP